MSFTVTLQPAQRTFEVQRDEPILAAAIRQGIGMPYGCKDGACGSCKSRLLEGRVIHGAHQLKALSTAEEDAGFILPCCAAPQTDCVLEARRCPAQASSRCGRCRPRDEPGARRRRRDDHEAAAAGQPDLQYRAGQYVEFILRDGARRSYSMANAPHTLGSPPAIELHMRHMPGGKFTDHVFSAMKEKEILRIEGPVRQLLPARGHRPSRSCCWPRAPASRRSRRIIEHMQFKAHRAPGRAVLGLPHAADLYLHDWARSRSRADAEAALRAGAVGARPDDGWTGRTGFVHRAVMADLPDLSGHQVYACGAPVMVESAHSANSSPRCGLPADEFYADAFTSEADKHPTV